MAWMLDSDFPSAGEHVGYPAAVLPDGTDAFAIPPNVGARVTGWTAACFCGWRGDRFYPRAEFPSPDGIAPEQVDGMHTASATFAEWNDHLNRTLPELTVYAIAQELAQLHQGLRDAVRDAETAGIRRTRIDAVIRMAGAEIVLRPDVRQAGTNRVSRYRAAPPRRAPPRRPDGPALRET